MPRDRILRLNDSIAASGLPTASAVFSRCWRYRYLLTRHIGHSPAVVTFVMLNPSTADGHIDDPTIRKCVGFAARWGCGWLQVVNLFAYRAKRPGNLFAVADPVGRDNGAWIRRVVSSNANDAAHDGPVVCGWGVNGTYLDRDVAVLRLLNRLGVRLLTLGLTRDGHPRHPLYVPYTCGLIPFRGRCDSSIGGLAGVHRRVIEIELCQVSRPVLMRFREGTGLPRRAPSDHIRMEIGWSKS